MGAFHRFQITGIADLVLVLPEKSRKKDPQNGAKLFRMNNFLVIVLDNLIRIITLQKQWYGGVPALNQANSIIFNEL